MKILNRELLRISYTNGIIYKMIRTLTYYTTPLQLIQQFGLRPII